MIDRQKSAHLNLLTWNIRGFNNPKKIRQVFAYLDRHHIDIALLQESHLAPTHKNTVGTRWAEAVVSSPYSSYSRGVLILIRKGSQFHIETFIKDELGRYVLITGHIRGQRLALLNTYGPNVDDPEFYKTIWSKINEISGTAILWGGDLNLTLNDTLDRSGPTKEPHR